MYTHSKFRDLNKREEKKTSFSVLSYPRPWSDDITLTAMSPLKKTLFFSFKFNCEQKKNRLQTRNSNFFQGLKHNYLIEKSFYHGCVLNFYMHIIAKFCSFHIKIFNFNRRKSSEKPNLQASFNIKSKVYAYTDFFVLFLKFHHQSSAM